MDNTKNIPNTTPLTAGGTPVVGRSSLRGTAGQAKAKKQLRGIVVSDRADKTITVLVSRFVKHPKYKKYIKQSKRYKVHDGDNKHKVGNEVMIEGCRPISKDKHFKVV